MDYQDAIGKVLAAFQATKQNATQRAAALVDFEKKIAAFTPSRSTFWDIKASVVQFSKSSKRV